MLIKRLPPSPRRSRNRVRNSSIQPSILRKGVLLAQGPVFFGQQPMHQEVGEAGVVADDGPGKLEAFAPAVRS